jgi:hypothetical protein
VLPVDVAESDNARRLSTSPSLIAAAVSRPVPDDDDEDEKEDEATSSGENNSKITSHSEAPLSGLPPRPFKKPRSNNSGFRRNMKEGLRITALLPRSRSIPVKTEADDDLSTPKPFLRKLSGLRKTRSDASVSRSVASQPSAKNRSETSVSRSVVSQRSAKGQSAASISPSVASQSSTKNQNAASGSPSVTAQSITGGKDAEPLSPSLASQPSIKGQSDASIPPSVVSQPSTESKNVSVASQSNKKIESCTSASVASQTSAKINGSATASVASQSISKKRSDLSASPSSASRSISQKISCLSEVSVASRSSGKEDAVQSETTQSLIDVLLSKNSSAALSAHEDADADIIGMQSSATLSQEGLKPEGDEEEEPEIINKLSSTLFTEDGSTAGISQEPSEDKANEFEKARSDMADRSEDVFNGLGPTDENGAEEQTKEDSVSHESKSDSEPETTIEEIEDPWPNPWLGAREHLENHRGLNVYPNVAPKSALARVLGAVSGGSKSTVDTSKAGNVGYNKSESASVSTEELAGDSPAAVSSAPPKEEEEEVADTVPMSLSKEDKFAQTCTTAVAPTERATLNQGQVAPVAHDQTILRSQLCKEIIEKSQSLKPIPIKEQSTIIKEDSIDEKEQWASLELDADTKEDKPSMWKRTKLCLKSKKVSDSATSRSMEPPSSSSKNGKFKLGYLCFLSPCAKLKNSKDSAREAPVDNSGVSVLPDGIHGQSDTTKNSTGDTDDGLLPYIQILDHKESNDGLIKDLLDANVSEAPDQDDPSPAETGTSGVDGKVPAVSAPQGNSWLPVLGSNMSGTNGGTLGTLSSNTFGDEGLSKTYLEEPSVMSNFSNYVVAAQQAVEFNLFACDCGGMSAQEDAPADQASNNENRQLIRKDAPAPAADTGGVSSKWGGNLFSKVFGELMDVLECSPGQQTTQKA